MDISELRGTVVRMQLREIHYNRSPFDVPFTPKQTREVAARMYVESVRQRRTDAER